VKFYAHERRINERLGAALTSLIMSPPNTKEEHAIVVDVHCHSRTVEEQVVGIVHSLCNHTELVAIDHCKIVVFNSDPAVLCKLVGIVWNILRWRNRHFQAETRNPAENWLEFGHRARGRILKRSALKSNALCHLG